MQIRFNSVVGARIALLTLVGCLPSTAVKAQSQSASAPAATEKEAPPAKPANLKPAVGYIIVDLTADPEDRDATQISSFPAAMVTVKATVGCASPTLPTGIGVLAFLAECAASGATPINNRIAAAERIRDAAQAAAKQGTTRFITTKGEFVRVVVIGQVQAFSGKGAKAPVFVRGKKPSVAFKEKARETQLVTDLKSLVQVAGGIFGKAEAGAGTLPDATTATVKDVLWAFVSTHGLRETRAIASVSVEAGQATTVLAKPPTIDDKDIAGFLERWEAAQVPQVACTDALTSPRVTPLVILTCRAKEAENLEERINAIEGLGTLGDTRATRVLLELTTYSTPKTEKAPSPDSQLDLRVRTAALTALSKLKTAAPAAAAAAPAKAAEEAPAKPSVDVITGPREHWFLSADVPITEAKALTFDKDTGQVTLGDEPSTFYLGVNFLAGDLKDPKRSLLGNLVVKGLLKASNRPLESFGFGLGLRGQYLAKLGLNLDALTPFVAMTFTQEDVEENGVVTRRARRNSEFRFGVSLNLDQAAKWVGGK